MEVTLFGRGFDAHHLHHKRKVKSTGVGARLEGDAIRENGLSFDYSAFRKFNGRTHRLVTGLLLKSGALGLAGSIPASSTIFGYIWVYLVFTWIFLTLVWVQLRAIDV